MHFIEKVATNIYRIRYVRGLPFGLKYKTNWFRSLEFNHYWRWSPHTLSMITGTLQQCRDALKKEKKLMAIDEKDIKTVEVIK